MQGNLGKAIVGPFEGESQVITCVVGSDRSESRVRAHETRKTRSELHIHKSIALLVAVIMTISAVGVLSVPLASNQPLKMRTLYVSHAPIVINGDGQFTNASGVVWGSGSASDPFIIEGYDIDSSAANGIDIRNTNSYFIIRNVNINSTTNVAYVGIFFSNVANGQVENASLIRSNNQGIQIEHSSNVRLDGNSITNPGWWVYGIHLSYCSYIVVSRNNVSKDWMGVLLESCANVTVADNNASSSASHGIYCVNSHDLNLIDNNVSQCGNGMYFYDSDNLNIIGNNASNRPGSDDYGIDLNYCDAANVSDNNISNTRYGLRLSFCREITARGNVFASNGILVDGNSLEYYNTHTIATDNMVNEKPIHYYKNGTNIDVDGIPVGQLIVANCTNVLATNLIINNTITAIEMAFVHDSEMENVAITNIHDYGVLLRYSDNVSIVDSDMSNNGYDGVHVEHCSDVNIVGTKGASNANTALFFADCTNSKIQSNNFSGGGTAAFDIMACTGFVLKNNEISNANLGVRLSGTNFEIASNDITRTNYGLYVNGGTNVSVTGNNVSNNNACNIYLASTTIADISNNDASSCVGGSGIYAGWSSKVNITNNNVSHNAGEGIYIYWSIDTIVADNDISNDRLGLYLYYSQGVAAKNNTFASDGIVIEGSSLQYYNTHTITTDNLVNGKPVRYYKNGTDINVSSIPTGQLIVANCTNFQSANLIVNNTNFGVMMAYASGGGLDNLTVSLTNRYGIYLETCENITVMNSNITMNTGYDICARWGKDLTISHNVVTNNVNWGENIYIESCTDTNVMNNTIAGCRGILIHINGGTNTSVCGNNASSGSYGIVLDNCVNSIVADNIATRNDNYNIHPDACINVTVIRNDASGGGVSDFGIPFWSSRDVSIIDNIANDVEYEGIRGGYTIGINVEGNVASSRWSGAIVLIACTNSNITDNRASTSGGGGDSDGIRIYSCANTNITDNFVSASSNPSDGIGVYQCTGFNVTRNNASSCSDCGIYVYYSSVGFIRENSLWNNTYGICLVGSTSLWVYHNNLLDNSCQAYDDMGSENTWDDGYPGGGNYWSNYSGTDLFKGPGQDVPGSDGRGDASMIVDSNTADRYPLMYMWFSWASPITTHNYVNIWHNASFAISLTATENPPGCQVVETYYRVNGGTTKAVSADGQPAITTDSASNSLEFWSVDFDGKEEIHNMLTSIKLDTTDPTGSVTIDDGATSTNTTSVALNLTGFDATSGIAQMRFHNESSSWSAWEAYSTLKAWNLSSGDGIKTVYVQFMDFAGNPSIVYSDSIKLEQNTPMNLRIVASDNDIILIWNPVTGASHYHIYISTARNGFDLSAPSASTTATTWIHFNANLIGDANYSMQYFYLVRAVDAGGVEDFNINILGKYTYVLEAGVGGKWNQFALALEPLTNYSVDSLADAIPHCDGIAWFNQTSQQWIFHATVMSSGVFDAMVVMGTGYQVSIDNATPIVFTLVGR